MAERRTNPRVAMDYPHLDDELWIIWSGNEYKWPDGRRETRYLTDRRHHIMQGWALATIYACEAATFESEAEARRWLAEQEAKRPHPYLVNITTVRAMKIARGYERES